ncbi:MAG: undecaprenyldiphospho-muramoylpentapeptide beta-N-acetylglucosaminyltransferase [Bacteroidetes bacterium]|nr:undecaprenyldiphospho-muramoylpentapeptide beta-N-acetylglucosaminyltransferase [Bacteroidota bacterium]
MITGGGTGGHIFPAVAVATEFRSRFPDSDVLFVGAKGRMEMTRVPEAGFRIIGLWISGFQRRLTISNLLLPLKMLVSYIKAHRLISRFRPHAVVGTGGYASGPLMFAAVHRGVPTVIQEQNSYAGMANKQLASSASSICVAYDGMEKYFPAAKVKLTGNPVRRNILQEGLSREEAARKFGLDPSKKIILVVGGSLGARTLNQCIEKGAAELEKENVQVIWQTGKLYYQAMVASAAASQKNIVVLDFIQDMAAAYAAADLVISRAGALAISELCIAGKPVVLVPSPHVAEDHQTKNAMALVNKGAARVVKDSEAVNNLVSEVLTLLRQPEVCSSLSSSIRAMARPEATKEIVEEIVQLIKTSAR